MVTVIDTKQLKYKVNQDDHNPPHVHVEGCGAKIRINLLTLEFMDEDTDFNTATLRRIKKYVKENRETFMEAWHEFHEKD